MDDFIASYQKARQRWQESVETVMTLNLRRQQIERHLTIACEQRDADYNTMRWYEEQYLAAVRKR